MNPDHWQRAKELFSQACERAPEHRASFLAEACLGDEDLRREVSSLLESHQETGSVFDEPVASAFGAWVQTDDETGTMHFPTNHFTAPPLERTERIIHERSHTLFKVRHDGMTPGGELDFGKAADDDNGFTYEQAVNNAYCYGWLATALQPDYVPSGGGEVIMGTPR